MNHKNYITPKKEKIHVEMLLLNDCAVMMWHEPISFFFFLKP